MLWSLLCGSLLAQQVQQLMMPLWLQGIHFMIRLCKTHQMNALRSYSLQPHLTLLAPRDARSKKARIQRSHELLRPATFLLCYPRLVNHMSQTPIKIELDTKLVKVTRSSPSSLQHSLLLKSMMVTTPRSQSNPPNDQEATTVNRPTGMQLLGGGSADCGEDAHLPAGTQPPMLTGM